MPREATLKLRPCNKPGWPFVLPIPLHLQGVVGCQKKYFKTETEGKEFVRDLKNKTREHGTKALTLGAAEAIEIEKARTLLFPYNVSILDAVTAHVGLLSARHKLGSRTVQELIDSYIASLASKSPEKEFSKHVIAAKYRLKRFGAHFAGYQVHDLSRAVLSRWLRVQYTGEKVIDGSVTPAEWIPETIYSPVSAAGFHQYISGCLEYGRMNEMVKENIMSDVPKPRGEMSDVVVFSPGQIAKIFEHCEELLVVYFALGAFAGLRPSEIEVNRKMNRGLKWRDINLDDRTIFVDTYGDRTYRSRHVGIRDNLLPVLVKYYGKADDFVFPHSLSTLRRRRADVCDKLEISEWPQDVLRHSFCSYNLKNAVPLSQMVDEMGHSGPDMIKLRYRNPRITPMMGQKYCSIDVLKIRAGAAGNILPMIVAEVA